MRKQTKLVAVLSAAALLALGASMTSFAATGWQEENGTWVYYNKSGDQITDSWAKSGDNWFYLNGDGELSTEQLIEDDNDNYYYVDANGAMVRNAWVAIENEDAGDDNEPDQWWYYFGNNGKAYTGNDNINLKSINGKKYAFNADGQMLYGWIKDGDTTIINDNDDAWSEGDYYFGSSDDGAMTVGWLLMDITDDSADTTNKFTAPVFKDDEDQSRWFCFKSSGKKWAAESGSVLKEKTINGAKYAFDEYGRMVAEWSTATTGNTATAANWKYFSDVESGARVTKGWFKVVPAEEFFPGDYKDDEEGWYYTNNSGNLVTGQFKTIKGKKYAFKTTGKMVNGLKFIKDTGNVDEFDVISDDNGTKRFDSEDDFLANASYWVDNGYKCYFFGDSSDGAMRTGNATVNIDGDNFTFNFGKSGSAKGAGVTKIDDHKAYTSGMVIKAGKDEKYQVVKPKYSRTTTDLIGFTKYADAKKFTDGVSNITNLAGGRYTEYSINQVVALVQASSTLSYSDFGLTKSKAEAANGPEYSEAVFYYDNTNSRWGLDANDYMLVNTSGKISTKSGKVKDGNDVYYKLNSGRIVGTFVED